MGLAMAHHATQESERVFVEQAKVGSVILRLNSAFPGAVDAYAKVQPDEWIKLIDLDTSGRHPLGSRQPFHAVSFSVSAVTARPQGFTGPYGVSASAYGDEDIVAVIVGANAPDNTYLRGVALARQYGVPLLTSL